MSDTKKINITVLLTAGRLPLDLMDKARELAEEHDLGIYLSTLQNLRLTGVPESIAPDLKAQLAELGAQFKAPDLFPIPRVCVGKDHCNLGLVDTEAVSQKILAPFKDRKKTKPKIKIALSACTACCSGAKTTDIGIVATRGGYDLYAGGKGGTSPKVGHRIAKKIDEGQMVQMIEQLVDFHDANTNKKNRMAKLMESQNFPFETV